MLMQLASHFWRPDFSPAQAGALIADYATDLADCTIVELEIAIRDYRLRPEVPGKMKPFPGSGTLRQMALDYRKHRQELDRIGKPVKLDSRPIMWWAKPRALWASHWCETQAPDGALVHDKVSGKLRPAYRIAEQAAE